MHDKRFIVSHIRRIMAIVLICIFSAGSLATQTVSASDNEEEKTLSPRKVISMVYDDSGSMHVKSNPSWAYANYAMQTFTGLLNPDDILMVTFMSDIDHVVKCNSSGILETFSTDRQKTIDNIRKNTKGGGVTPFGAIKAAGEALKSVDDTDPSTQYWLVVITDGAFEKKPGDEKSNPSQKELNKEFNKYAGMNAANGTPVNCMFMAIGKNKDMKFPAENTYIENFHAKKAGNIVKTLSSIADKISGRYRLDSDAVKVSDKTITVSSTIPLLNTQVLTQNSDAKVSSAKAEEGGDFNTDSISLASPGKEEGRNAGDKLFGNLCKITSGNDYIEEGTYVIEMTKPVKKEDLVVLYEPALETRVRVLKDGDEVKDPSILRQDDTVDIICDIVRMGTDKQIDPASLPSGMFESFGLTLTENGVTAEEKTLGKGEKQLEIKDYTLVKGETVIEGKLQLKDFAPLEKRIVLKPKKPVVYGITADKGDELTLRRGYINGKKSVDFTVTGDGEPLPKSEIESLIDKESISITFGEEQEKTGVKFRYEITEDGKVRVYPKASFLTNAWAFFSVPKGDYDVTVTVNEGTSATGHFKVKGYPIWGIIISLIILALFLLLLYLVMKPHFPEGTIHYVTLQFNGEEFAARNSGDVKLGFFTDFFRVFGPRRASVNGMKIYADEPQKIYISSNWLKSYIVPRDEDEPESGSDEYYICYFNAPGSDNSLSDSLMDALEDFSGVTRDVKSRDKNMQFPLGQPLLSIDNAGTEAARINTFQYRKY